jgi:anti-sigma-K factor RskA
VVHEHVAGFALDALSATEASEFEHHLRSCPDCEDELERLRTTAAALAFAGNLPVPPAALRPRVLDVGGVVIRLRRLWTAPLLSAGVVAAACVAIVVAGHGWRGERPSVGGLRVYKVSGTDGELLVGRTGEAVLVVRGLPSPAAGTTYELWVVRGGAPIAAGFLRGRLGVLTQPVRPGAAVAVSLEPTGGSRRPTGPLLLRAETA